MTIQEVKLQSDIITTAIHLGISINKDEKALCPFHKDKTPSLQFSKTKQIATCFSSNCSAGTMDVIGLVKRKLDTSTHEALIYLKNLKTGMKTGQKIEVKKEGLEKISTAGKTMSNNISLSPKTVNYHDDFTKMEHSFSKSSLAKDYLNERGVKYDEIHSFLGLNIGYNAFKGGKFNYLRGCVCFGLRNREGKVVSMYGRSILKGKSASSHYYTSNRRGLYPNYPSIEATKLILTESIIDAATLLSVKEITGSYEMLSLYGTNGLTAEHVFAMQQLKQLDEIILFFDGDEAGRAANDKHGKYLKELFTGVKVSVVDTLEGEDINSLLEGHDESILMELLQNRKPFLDKELGDQVNEKNEQTSFVSNELSVSREQEVVKQAPVQKGFSLDKTPISSEVNNGAKGVLNTKDEQHITYQKGDLKCVLLGGISMNQLDRLRVTLLLERVPKLNPLHSIRQSGLDLYNDVFVEKFGRSAADKLEVGTSEIRLILAELIEELERYRLAAMNDKKQEKPLFRTLSDIQKEKALTYLKGPDLLARTNKDIGKAGIVGEEVNRLLMYIAFTSRLREMPLHIISLGASGTGKTYLQEKIAELIPEQDIVEITVLSDNAFYYFKQKELAHKLVLIEDMDGAENVLLPLRELMSKKRISKRVVIKNSAGNMSTVPLLVEGPICVAGTTTKESVYEDNANRSLLIYRDNSSEHQELIMDYQRALSAREINSIEEGKVKELFKDMQSLLKPVKVRNPYAGALKIPAQVFKPLRSNAHYLQFIECVTFYHQYQREWHLDKVANEYYINTTLEDIEAANYLLKDVLLAKADELNGACRKFFEVLKTYLKKEGKQSFYAKAIRSDLRISSTTLKRHLYYLQSNDYIKIVGGDKFRKGFEYEVVSYQEYNELQGSITTALDKALENIKKGLK
jgi:DNA primase